MGGAEPRTLSSCSFVPLHCLRTIFPDTYPGPIPVSECHLRTTMSTGRSKRVIQLCSGLINLCDIVVASRIRFRAEAGLYGALGRTCLNYRFPPANQNRSGSYQLWCRHTAMRQRAFLQLRRSFVDPWSFLHRWQIGVHKCLNRHKSIHQS